MSPSEFELRAALHDGEGDEIDAGRVIMHAEAIRRTRRARALSVAATVVVVAALGTTFSLVHLSGSQQHSASGGNYAQKGAAVTAPSGATVPTALGAVGSQNDALSSAAAGAGSGNAPGAAAAACPATVPSVANTTGSSDRTAAIFSEPVTSLLACGYAITASGHATGPVAQVLTGAAAQAVATSMNAATATPQSVCSGPPMRASAVIVLYGEYATGPAQAVVAEVDLCNLYATNGNTQRYHWYPPKQLDPLLAQLAKTDPLVTVGPAPAPKPTMNGSPAK